jgi:hypothetical protein
MIVGFSSVLDVLSKVIIKKHKYIFAHWLLPECNFCKKRTDENDY